MKVKLFIVLLAGILQGFAQSRETGSIEGTIKDEVTGEPLPGANAILEGTTIGAAADFDGKFKITNIPEGKYNLIIKLISYKETKITDVIVKPGITSSYTASLQTSQTELNEVVIEAAAKRESVNAMLIQQQKSINVSDGISAETIKRTPDKNTSDILKRVSGTTIQDNKFAIVRGLNERYNSAYINGAPLPSSESDRKAFSFDIFPSSMIDNITILKSASPDKPADFAGGIILVNTRAIPEENFQSVSVSSGYNTVSTFKDYVTYKGGNFDYLGFDDGTRQLPAELPATEDFRKQTTLQNAETAQLRPSDWALHQKPNSQPALSLQYTIGNVFKIKETEVGSIWGITYNNGFIINNSIRREFEEQEGQDKPTQTIELKDTEYKKQVQAAGISNISVKLKKNHLFSFKNMFTLNSDNGVVVRDGIRDFAQDTRTLEKGSVRSFSENKLYSSQLEGEHTISKVKINWIGSYSDINRNIPNLRRMLYSKTQNLLAESGEPEAEFEASIPTSGTSPSSGGNIFYSSMNEKVYNGSYDISLNLPGNKTVIKAGGYHHLRDRSFSARQFGYSRYSQGSKVKFKKELLLLPEDSIFLPGNMGIIQAYQPAANGKPAVNGIGGFKLEEATKLNDTYYASSATHAGYLMANNTIFKDLKVSYGARIESFNQTLESFEDDGDTISVDTTTVDILPSMNMIYSVNDKTNIRVSYGQTVCRPEFRELAPFGFFDFVTFFTVRGNPELKRTLINNYEIKYERFPGMGQLLSVAAFYKHFENAIEQVNRHDVPRELFYANVPTAKSYGIELEYRVNIGQLINSELNWLNNFSTFSNLAFIKSEVDVSEVEGSLSDKRPLQGQSSYIMNAGAQYNNLEKRFNITLMTNRIGRRLAIVGNEQEPDIYENPRTVMDLTISKTFFKSFEIKASARDILSERIMFYQDIDKNGTLSKDKDNIMAETQTGKTFGISLSYRF